MGARRQWTPDEIALIGTMPHRQLANLLGRTVESVKQRACYEQKYKVNREKILDRKRRWVELNKPRKAAKDREYRERNGDKIRECKASYYRNNRHLWQCRREENRIKQADRRRLHPDRAREICRKSRLRMLSSNPNYYRDYYRDYYRKNAARLAAKSRAHYHANRTSCLLRMKAWRERNPEYQRTWRQRNPEKSRQLCRESYLLACRREREYNALQSLRQIKEKLNGE